METMAHLGFTRKSFAYFDGARRHAFDREWFDAHKAQYAEHVEVPLTHLIFSLKEQLAGALPGILFSPRKISKPLKRQNRVSKDKDGPLLRHNATAFFAETATSMFESNPGIYLSFGANEDDNVYGCGLYMPSSRQVKELRPHFGTERETLHRILHNRTFRKHWTGLSGDRYKRFPKDFDETAPGSEYLWQKQFFISRTPTRADVLQPEFIERTVEAMAAAVPFLTWTREAVGIYRKSKPRHEELY